LDESVLIEDSSDDEFFERDYPFLHILKYKTDTETILDELLNHKLSLKTMIMLPVEKYLKRLKEPLNIKEYDQGTPQWNIEVMRHYSVEDTIYGLLIVIRLRSEELLLQIWDSQIVDERHFFIVFDKIV